MKKGNRMPDDVREAERAWWRQGFGAERSRARVRNSSPGNSERSGGIRLPFDVFYSYALAPIRKDIVETEQDNQDNKVKESLK